MILLRGKFEGPFCEQMQTDLRTIENWCKTHTLTVNPRKTDMVFTKKNKIGLLTVPRLLDTHLCFALCNTPSGFEANTAEDHNALFTDGSKTSRGVGCGTFSRQRQIHKWAMDKYASITQTELDGINMAAEEITHF